MIRIPMLAVGALALSPLLCFADDPCGDTKKQVASAAKAMDFSAADKRAPTGHFTVQHLPANKNNAVERFELKYLVNGKAVWSVNDSPVDDGSLVIRAAGKQLFYDILYGAGGGVQCHFVIRLENGKTTYRQTK